VYPNVTQFETRLRRLGEQLELQARRQTTANRAHKRLFDVGLPRRVPRLALRRTSEADC
jgi:hypothetical protein